jgi:Zn-dependent peptidase ImmA (M78 family)
MIPKQITVGKTTYKIRRGSKSGYLGHVDYDEKIISVAVRDGLGNKLEPEEVRDTFWHELTHAVLHDMGHPLRNDEKFVVKFANRLSCAIDSAQL